MSLLPHSQRYYQAYGQALARRADKKCGKSHIPEARQCHVGKGVALGQPASTKISKAFVQRYYDFSVKDYTAEEKRNKPAQNKYLKDRPAGYYNQEWTVDHEVDAIGNMLNILTDDGTLTWHDQVSSRPKEVASYINWYRSDE